MSPHRRTETELDAAQRQAELASIEAQQVMREVEENKPKVNSLIEALKSRRIENHLARDYEITLRRATT